MTLAGRHLLDGRAVATYMFAMVEIAIINKTAARSEVVEDKGTFRRAEPLGSNSPADFR
jgi:hypothetical protein